MRFKSLLTSILAATLITAAVAPGIAAACGGYVRIDPAPRMLQVSSHRLFSDEARKQRAFVVLEQSFDGSDATWSQLAPGTFDNTRLVALPALAVPLQVTLVGPSGVRFVKSDKQVALADAATIGWREKRVAVEVPVTDKDQFAVAIIGHAKDARWHAADYLEAPASARWWLGKRGTKSPDFVALRKLDGTSAEAIEFSQDGETHFVIRRGDVEVGSAQGSLIGAVTTNGRTFVLYTVNKQLATLELPATARS
jgi:hypothetical protein